MERLFKDMHYVNYLPPAPADIHLATLIQCNHTIATVGSFSWWIGYLTGGEVLYYKDWPKENSEAARRVVKTDYFLPSWTGLSWSKWLITRGRRWFDKTGSEWINWLFLAVSTSFRVSLWNLTLLLEKYKVILLETL